MTEAVRDATILGVNVDTGRIFYGDDPHYEIWLGSLMAEVQAKRIEIAREEERRMKK